MSRAALLLVLCAGCGRVPDREILFQARPPNDSENIWALNPRNGEARRITTGDSSLAHAVPAWSPDGRSIAFTRELPDHDELWIQDSAGARPRRIAQDAPRALSFPAWSPDGASLLFNAGLTIDRMGVWLIRPDGGGLRRILSDSTNYRCPSWSPDGRRFVVGASTPYTSEILEFDLTTSARSARTFSDSTFLDCPQYSPDGSRILFTVVHGGTDPQLLSVASVTANLAVLELASGRQRWISRNAGVSSFGHWSRDGKWIVFQSDRHAAPEAGDSVTTAQRLANLEIYIVRATGRRLRRLTTNEYMEAHPSW